MLFLYTLPKHTLCALSHILSGPWRKFLVLILFCSHFTTSYMLWETCKHGVDDIHQWRSFHTRIRENRSTSSKVVLLQKLQRGHTSGIEVSKTNILFTCVGRKVCSIWTAVLKTLRGIAVISRWRRQSHLLSSDALATQIEATSMPRLAVLCNSDTPGCWTPQSQYLLAK
jgi:hypothetical protein